MLSSRRTLSTSARRHRLERLLVPEADLLAETGDPGRGPTGGNLVESPHEAGAQQEPSRPLGWLLLCSHALPLFAGWGAHQDVFELPFEAAIHLVGGALVQPSGGDGLVQA